MKVVPDKDEMAHVVLSVEAILKAGEELCASGEDIEICTFWGLFRAGKWLIDPIVEFISEGRS